MGLSGTKGKVYYIDSECPVFDCDDWTVPAGSATCWTDEVTKFDIDDAVQMRKYGHDKSKGWQDNCAGIRGLTISMEVNVKLDSEKLEIHPGKVVWLLLYPYGTAGTCANNVARGYATFERVSLRVDQETGFPVGYTATLASKGPWLGMGGEDGEWGGHECDCQ